jgi:polar amino acid transport system substrate-binding protein
MAKARWIVVLALTAGLTAACAHSSGTYILTSPSPVMDRIEKRGELVVGTAAGMPPLNMTTKDGRIIGFEADLAKYLADSMGVKLTLKPMLFKELLPSLERGKLDMVLSGVTMTTERNRKVAFVGPYYISGKGILTKIATLASIDKPGDIDQSKFRITALEGSTSEAFVQHVLSRAKYMPAKDYKSAVGMVIDDKVDLMLADHPICVVSVARYPQHDLFTIVAPFTYEPIGAALPANDALFVNLVQNFLNTLDGSGALDRLQERWFQKGDWWDQVE